MATGTEAASEMVVKAWRQSTTLAIKRSGESGEAPIHAATAIWASTNRIPARMP